MSENPLVITSQFTPTHTKLKHAMITKVNNLIENTDGRILNYGINTDYGYTQETLKLFIDNMNTLTLTLNTKDQ